MKIKTGLGTLLLAGSLLSGALLAQSATGQESSVPADNSAMNKRDRDSSQPTADQQKGSASDRETTRQIRRAITKDSSLSTYAHNVKIITQGGQVTLRGPVRSDDEKRAVEAKATEIAGAGRVNDQLEVKANNSGN